MKRIQDPDSLGFERDLVKTTKNECSAKDAHRSRVGLEQVSSLEVGLHEPGAERGDEIESGDEGEDGEPEGSVESWDGWDWVQERPEDEPERGWDQDGEEEETRKRPRLWTVDHDEGRRRAVD